MTRSPLDRPSDDALSQVLHTWRLQSSFTCRSELTGAWGLTMPAMAGCLWFHVVTAGSCVLAVEDEPPQILGVGSVALVPHGRGHALWSDPTAARPDVTELPHVLELERYAVLRHGGDGEHTGLICGIAQFADELATDVAALLPPILHYDAASAEHGPWLPATLALMTDEAVTLRPGGETVVTRLADILIIQAVRAWFDGEARAGQGWAATLSDPSIGRAIARIHQLPGHPWTVASLASEAALSRSGFAARFATLVGEPPLRYLTRHRMRVARRWLRERDVTVAEVAGLLCYQSEAAFSRAFKRFEGCAPSRAKAQG